MRRILYVAFAAGLILTAANAVRADEQADLKALLDKAIKAHGGEEKLTKYQASTSKIKGKVHVMGMDLDVAGEVSVQLPDRMRVEMGVEIMGMKFTTVQIISSDK